MFSKIIPSWPKPQTSPLQVVSNTNLTQDALTGGVLVFGNQTYNITEPLHLSSTLIFSPRTKFVISSKLTISSQLTNVPNGLFIVTWQGKVIIETGDVYANWFHSNTDFSASIKLAILSVSNWESKGNGSGRTVRINNGTYTLRSPIGIRSVSIIGSGWDSTIFNVDITGTNEAVFSQVLERDSVTTQREDGGRSIISGFTLRGTKENIASGIHTYGDGHLVTRVRVDSMYDGIVVELPIMTTVDTCYVWNSKRRGFWNKQANVNGTAHIGTSLSMRNCWAYRCGGSGFRIETLSYSSFDNCASQECGYAYDNAAFDDSYGWVLRGNMYGEGMMSKVSFNNIGSEGDSIAFLIVNTRDIELRNIKYIWGGTDERLGPSGALFTVGNTSFVLHNFRQTVDSNDALSGHFVTTDDITIDRRLLYTLRFIPDPSNNKWIYDDNGRDGAIVLTNSRISVEPFAGASGITANETRRFTCINSDIFQR